LVCDVRCFTRPPSVSMSSAASALHCALCTLTANSAAAGMERHRAGHGTSSPSCRCHDCCRWRLAVRQETRMAQKREEASETNDDIIAMAPPPLRHVRAHSTPPTSATHRASKQRPLYRRSNSTDGPRMKQASSRSAGVACTSSASPSRPAIPPGSAVSSSPARRPVGGSLFSGADTVAEGTRPNCSVSAPPPRRVRPLLPSGRRNGRKTPRRNTRSGRCSR